MSVAQKRPPVAVLGAGIGGLVAAIELRRQGHDVRVFEAAPKVAGMAATERDDEGFSFDVGAHFITNRLAAALGVSADCRVVRRYGESVLLDERSYRYPLGLMRIPRFLMAALQSRAESLRGGEEPLDAAGWFRREYGAALADEVALPLLEAWSGTPAGELAAAVGGKIPSSIAHTIYLRAAARLTQRAVAIGYCNAKPQAASVFHVYPEHGVGSICEKLAAELGDAVEVNAPVDKIHVDQERTVGLTVGGRTLDVSGVVSTAPIHVLPNLVEGSTRLEPFRRFRFRPLLLVNLKMEGRDLLSDVVVWVPKGSPFFRLTEAPASMPWLAPDGKTTILAEIGAEVGDEMWEKSDEELIALCASELERMVPGAAGRCLGGRVMRPKIAYPIFHLDYEADRQRLAESGTGIHGLLSIGRNGEFDHILMEDIYWRTLGRIRADAELGARASSLAA